MACLSAALMPSISADEYPALKAFWAAWFERFPLPPELCRAPEDHPLAVLASMEKKSPALARKGLGMAINDTLEMSWDLRAEQVRAIDTDFAARGLPTLSELRRRYSRQFRSILKRGKIRDDGEYEMIVGILASGSGDASAGEREALEALLASFKGL